jgi:hypothetical protein
MIESLVIVVCSVMSESWRTDEHIVLALPSSATALGVEPADLEAQQLNVRIRLLLQWKD